MTILSIEMSEHSIEGTMVSQKVIKFFGLPIFSKWFETSNYNVVGQFDPANFTSNQEEKKDIPLYTETHIGFNSEENEKTTV